MLYLKTGMPEEGDIVLCTITNIHFHSVFVSLDEYNKAGLVHISEVSPGRIRNLRDYVSEGKKIVCKVIRIDQAKGHIDLSLRRVNENQRRQKVSEMKQEQLAESIVGLVAKQRKMPVEKLYDEVVDKVAKEYDALYPCFHDVAREGMKLESLGVDKKLADELTEVINQRIKETVAELKGTFTITTYEKNGVVTVKEALAEAKKVDESCIALRYEGGGRYKITVVTNDVKQSQKILDSAVSAVESYLDRKGAAFKFAKQEA